MNNLLIDDYPLVVLPNLAKEIGLNEAILLQQIHFWMNKRKNVRNGVSWVYNTYDGWVSQFPFWSKSTIRRTINSLEKKNLLITGNFNKLKVDNTKWYTINYEELKRVSRPPVQNEQTECSKWTDGPAQNEQTNTIDYPETTTKTNNIPYVEIIEYLNQKTGKRFRHSTEKTRSLIRARWNEGFRLDDFKRVIDICTAEWKGKTFSNGQPGDNYLQPSTLFNGKFEERLNWVDTKQPTKQHSKTPEQLEQERLVAEMKARLGQ